MLNQAIFSHWENWARIFLMVVIAGIAFDCIGQKFFNDKN